MKVVSLQDPGPGGIGLGCIQTQAQDQVIQVFIAGINRRGVFIVDNREYAMTFVETQACSILLQKLGMR